MKAIRVAEKSSGADALKVDCAEVPTPQIGDGECLVEVRGCCINPSDAKGLLGVMPYLVWPRTPGRDYAGVVVDGPSDLIGKEVWGGGGGDLGMQGDGTHAQFVRVPTASVREKPSTLSFLEAGSLGVSWTCAWYGLHRARLQAGETVVVTGVNGKVGEAVIQLATRAGARVIGVERQGKDYRGYASAPIDIIDLSQEDFVEGILERTDGRGAEIIYNTAGSPYFHQSMEAAARQGRQIIIATFEKEMPFNLLQFYRKNLIFVGVSNMDNSCTDCADVFEELRPGFEDGTLKPYAVKDDAVFSLDQAKTAYATVLEGKRRDRIMFDPQV